MAIIAEALLSLAHTIIERLVTYTHGANDNSVSSHEELLRVFLRRFPQWRSGHVQLARRAIRSGTLSVARASSFSALLLSKNYRQKKVSLLLVATVFVRMRDFERAQEILDNLIKEEPFSPAIREELAAVAFAQGRMHEMPHLLFGIPRHMLSLEAQQAGVAI
jgi:hypothetical protein